MIKKINLIDGKILEIDNICSSCNTNRLSNKSILYQLNHDLPLTCYKCSAINRLKNPIKYINYTGARSRSNKAYKQSRQYK